MLAAVAIFAPLIAWHAYRARRAIRSGAFASFGDTFDRALQPAAFWFAVSRQLLACGLLAAALVSVLLDFGDTALMWLFGGYLAVYVGMVLLTVVRLRRRSTSSLGSKPR